MNRLLCRATAVSTFVLLGLLSPVDGFSKPRAFPSPVADTIVGISGQAVDAALVGCDARKGDTVLVNGRPPSGEVWELIAIIPAGSTAVSPSEARAYTEMSLSPPTEVAAHVWVRLIDGYYNFALAVGACHFEPAPLVVPHPYGARGFTLFRSNGVVPRYDPVPKTGGVYGSIPFESLQVSLASDVSNLNLAGRVEREASHEFRFFFDAVPPGDYVLRVQGFGWTKDLGRVTARAGETTIHNVGVKDIRP